MANMNLTDATAILKRLYKPNKIGDVVSADNVALNLLPKFKELTGPKQVVPVQSGYVQNSSGGDESFNATYSKSSAIVDAFEVSPVKLMGRATIDGQAMRLSTSDLGAFISTAELQIDGALKGRAANFETQLFRDGWGDIGVIAAAGVSGATFTLASVEDVVNFEKGMNLVFSSAQSSATLRSATPIKVIGRNAITGVITCDTALSTPGAQAGDYVFMYGDRQNSATPTRLCVAGFGAWIPQTAPATSDSFFGVDRSSDPTRLGGLRLDATGGDLVEIVNTAAGLVAREGRKFTHLFMSEPTFAQYTNALGGKYEYQAVNLKGSDELTVGASGIKWLSHFGEIKVVPSRKCPSTKMFGLKLDSWQLASKGEPIGILDNDLKMVRIAGEDTYEVRVGGDVNLHCNEPGSNIQIYNVGS